VEFITGETYEQYEQKYVFGTMDATKETLHELTGVNICCTGNTEIFCIPKTKKGDEIYAFMLKNNPCKFKVLKKTRGTYTDYGVQTHQRERNLTNYNTKR
jgi:hypothetical protein